ncbi:MAG: endopeptidase La [Acidimicrobiia bacterium]|nr:endopeptidase La [Acidimicrobiia bacterium]
MTTTEIRVLPVLPVPDGVVLPDMVVTVALETDEARTAVDSAADGELLVVPRVGGRFARVGVLGRIENRGRLPNGVPALTVRALGRARVGNGVVGSTAALWVEADPLVDRETTPDEDERARRLRVAAKALLEKVGGRRMAGAIDGIDTAGSLADSVGYWPDLSLERRLALLEAIDVGDRLDLALGWVEEAWAELELRDEIGRKVTDDLDRTQRQALLRRQLQAIRAELDEADGGEDDLRARFDALDLPEAVRRAVEKELDKLDRTGGESMEASWVRTWLDAVAELPWGARSAERLDLAEARAVLDADHTGLDKVKERLIEHLAVRKLRAERPNGDALPAGTRRNGVILALAGPPGVGKTSLGESVARALGRSFVRLALGGIRDEAEIRGHRRTYVGARPGRVVRALIEAGSMNPVILLDEVDKLGADWRGDPSAALLEVLDPAQNHSFRDHYLEFELDLSDVVFIATANVLDTIPGPLRDRLEVIELDGYSEAEKAAIARDHLVARVVERNGLRPGELELGPGVVERIAADWTREAGVRRLERLLDTVARKAATRLAGGETAPIRVGVDDLRSLLGRPNPYESVRDRVDRPGVATGLAVTGAGGDVLLVESALVPGAGETLLTGQLGDVMKESAALAVSLVGSVGARYGAELPDTGRLHVHFPAGAVPKDGPSAGVTMTTALVSLLSGRTVRADVAMTGEISLGGRVLPIGGVKQKVLAAERAGIGTVILPVGNADDLDEVPADVRDRLDVHFATTIDDVLAVALTPAARVGVEAA